MDIYKYNNRKKRYYATNIEKNKFGRNVQIKLETCFIGDLHKFEQEFGQLWGHGKEYSKLTDVEKKWRQKWNECRTRILDHGNKQIRDMYRDLNNLLGDSYE